jgi:hypothetical protein
MHRDQIIQVGKTKQFPLALLGLGGNDRIGESPYTSTYRHRVGFVVSLTSSSLSFSNDSHTSSRRSSRCCRMISATYNLDHHSFRWASFANCSCASGATCWNRSLNRFFRNQIALLTICSAKSISRRSCAVRSFSACILFTSARSYSVSSQQSI